MNPPTPSAEAAANVQRYTLDPDTQLGYQPSLPFIREDADGEYVLHADYVKALAKLAEVEKERDVIRQDNDAHVKRCYEAEAKAAEAERDLEKLRLHAAAFPEKPDWIGEHLQKWIQGKDARVVQSEKIAHQAIDEKLAALSRSSQSDALLREALEAIENLHGDGDFRNGNTDATGSIDEGAVLTSQFVAAITSRMRAHLATATAKEGKTL